MKKLENLILKNAIEMVISDDEQIKSYRKLQRALSNGKGDAPAINYCSPYTSYQYDSVKNVINDIAANEYKLREFLKEAELIKDNLPNDKLVHNVLKVIDVNARDVDKRTIQFLTDYYCSYQDTMENMAEDLLNIVSAAEPDAMSQSKYPVVRKEIKKLARLAEKYDAAYVRFTVI